MVVDERAFQDPPLAKGLIDAILCFLIYKPLSPILHGRKRS